MSRVETPVGIIIGALADLFQRKDEERSASCGLGDDSDKLWVDGTVRRLPRTLGDANVVVTLLLLERLAKHVPELALSHDTE